MSVITEKVKAAISLWLNPIGEVYMKINTCRLKYAAMKPYLKSGKLLHMVKMEPESQR